MTHRCMIITAPFQTQAQDLFLALYGDGGANMFITGLSPDGNMPASHYVSSGHIRDTAADVLPCLSVDAEGVETLTPGQPEAVFALAQAAGFVITAVEVAALFAAMDVSDQDPFAAFARLGVQLASAPDVTL